MWRIACLLTVVLAACQQDITRVADPSTTADRTSEVTPFRDAPTSFWGDKCDLCALPPTVFERSPGDPATTIVTFSAEPVAPYRLVLVAEGGATADVVLNGRPVVRPDALDGVARPWAEVPVEVSAEDTLAVTTYGKPGSHVQVWVEPVPKFIDGFAVAVLSEDPLQMVLGTQDGKLVTVQSEEDGGYLVDLSGEGLIPSTFVMDSHGVPQSAIYPDRTVGFENWRIEGGLLHVTSWRSDNPDSVETTFPKAYSTLLAGLPSAVPAGVASATAPDDPLAFTVEDLALKAADLVECVRGNCVGLVLSGIGITADNFRSAMLSTAAGVAQLVCTATAVSLGSITAAITLPISAALLVYTEASPATVVITQGQTQVAAAGTTLPQTLRVAVRNRYGVLLNGIWGRFVALTNGGRFAGGATTVKTSTDDGFAEIRYTLSPEPGQNIVEYSTLLFKNITVTFFEVGQDPSLRGPVAYFPLDGDARDASGNGYDGTLSGSPAFGANRFGAPDAALDFDGSPDALSLGDQVPWSNKFAVTMWARVDSLGGDFVRTFVEKHDEVGLWWDTRIAGGSFRFYLPGTSAQSIDAPMPLPLGRWIHLAASYDGTTMTLYVNGDLVASAPATGTRSNSGYPLYIASDESFVRHYTWGSTDDVKIYDRGLTAEEVQAMAADGPAATGVARQ